MRIPRGKATARAATNPARTRLNETARLRVRARSNQSEGSERTTSTGEGRMVGEMRRSSGMRPAVTANHISSSTAIGTTPRAQGIQAGSGSRMRSQAPRSAAGPRRFGAGTSPEALTGPRAGRPRSPRAG
jgi:hypothetical protein